MSDESDQARVPIVRAVDAIREAPSMYLGECVTGALLTARLVETLLLLGDSPLRVVCKGAWYSVYSEKDWLLLENGEVSLDAFRRLIPLPSGGRFYDRAEVMLTALANAVVTCGIDGTNWISGEPSRTRVPDFIDLSLPQGRGRLVAFCYSQSEPAEKKV